MPTAEQTAEATERTDRLIERPPIIIYQGDLDRIEKWGTSHGLGDSAVTIRSLLDTLEESQQALLFYADKRNHQGVGVSQVYKDMGKLARQTVGRCETCKGKGWVQTGKRIMDQDGPCNESVTCHVCDGSGCKEGRP